MWYTFDIYDVFSLFLNQFEIILNKSFNRNIYDDSYYLKKTLHKQIVPYFLLPFASIVT